MKYYVLLIGALLGCMSCGESRNQSNQLDAAAELMFDHPEQALSILKSLDVDEISGRSDKARFALLYTQALDKNQIELRSDSLIHRAVDYYDRRGTEQEKALAHYYHGCVYANLHDTDAAMESLVEAEAHAVKTDDSYLQGLIHSRIGNLYSDEYLHEEAAFRKSTNVFPAGWSLAQRSDFVEQSSIYMLFDWRFRNGERELAGRQGAIPRSQRSGCRLCD